MLDILIPSVATLFDLFLQLPELVWLCVCKCRYAKTNLTNKCCSLDQYFAATMFTEHHKNVNN